MPQILLIKSCNSAVAATAAMEEQCKSLKLVAAEILTSRQRGGSPEELHKLFTKGLLHLTLLKAANRTVCEETEQVGLFAHGLPEPSRMLSRKGAAQDSASNFAQVREATAEAKALFDNAELALQNLLYEKAHYLNEIRACRSFRC